MTTSMNASEAMLSRHSVRKYVPHTPIASSELNEILELAGSAPSAWNLQHWRFLVFQQEDTKQKLLPIAYNQQQVVDCSAVIAVLGDTQANLMASELYGEQLQAGNISQQVHDTLVGNINRAYASSEQVGTEAAILNSSLAAMQLMLAAKEKGWDTCSMGGFSKEQFVTEFNIPSRYVPVMLITLGKAAAPAHATSRLPLERTVFHESFPANQ